MKQGFSTVGRSNDERKRGQLVKHITWCYTGLSDRKEKWIVITNNTNNDNAHDNDSDSDNGNGNGDGNDNDNGNNNKVDSYL